MNPLSMLKGKSEGPRYRSDLNKPNLTFGYMIKDAHGLLKLFVKISFLHCTDTFVSCQSTVDDNFNKLHFPFRYHNFSLLVSKEVAHDNKGHLCVLLCTLTN